MLDSDPVAPSYFKHSRQCHLPSGIETFLIHREFSVSSTASVNDPDSPTSAHTMRTHAHRNRHVLSVAYLRRADGKGDSTCILDGRWNFNRLSSSSSSLDLRFIHRSTSPRLLIRPLPRPPNTDRSRRYRRSSYTQCLNPQTFIRRFCWSCRDRETIAILRHARKFIKRAAHPLHEKPKPDFKATRLAMLPSLVNVNTPRIAIHRRLDFIHHASLIRSTRFRPRSAASPKNLIAPQSSEPARSISTTTNGVCVRAGRRAGDVPNSTFSWKRLRPHRSYCRQSRQSPKSVVDMLSLESSSNCHYDVIAPVCCRYYTVFLVISFMLTVIARFNYRHSFIS